MPWLMVRLPCGSMSTHKVRCPDSANAQARFSVVVVLATPPFWLANAMTLALFSTTGSAFSSGIPYTARYSDVVYGFLHARIGTCRGRRVRDRGSGGHRQHRPLP